MPGDWAQLPLAGGYRLVEPTADGVAHIAQHLRLADREEVYAATGSRDFHFALHCSLSVSDHAVMAIADDGEPVALLGVSTSSVIYNTGCPWMLATERSSTYARALVRGGRAYSAAMLEQYQRLENWVDARNAKAVAWLRRVGFRLEPATPYGALQMPFHRFSIER